MNDGDKTACDLIDNELRVLRKAINRDHNRKDFKSKTINKAIANRFISLRLAIVFHSSLGRVD